MNRRHFVMSSAVAAGAAVTSRKLVAASDKVRVAVVGVRGQGNSHIRAYSRDAECRDRSAGRHRRERARQASRARSRRPPARSRRATPISARCSRTKNIDAVSIATPNHSHALQTIWTLAGRQARLLREAADPQHLRIEADRGGGPQVRQDRPGRRECPLAWRSAWKPCRRCGKGLIGDVYMARGLCFKRRDTIGRAKPEPVPAGVHYDLWLGPAPKTRVHQEPLPLHLALVLGLRQWRLRESGHSRTGHRALGSGREVSDQDLGHRRALHVRR